MRIAVAWGIVFLLAACAAVPASKFLADDRSTGEGESQQAATPATTADVSPPDPTPMEQPASAMNIKEPSAWLSDPLKRKIWEQKVGNALGIWISVPEQTLYVIENGTPVRAMRCSTGLNGVGAEANSNKTPPGWHCIAEKIGENEPIGRVFRARKATKEIWKYGMDTEEDLVLTRILILEGQEIGVNQGKNQHGTIVDSRQRYIYIHGTNNLEGLGEALSKGCIRVSNDDAVYLFDKTSVKTPVYIQPE